MKPLPCPWCPTPPVVDRRTGYLGRRIYRVRCDNESCEACPRGFWHFKLAEAIAAWNNRHETRNTVTVPMRLTSGRAKANKTAARQGKPKASGT